MTSQTSTSAQTQALGEEFAQKIIGGGVVCLYGNLGAGKTTFVQGIAKGLNVKETVSSPTFVLMRRYEVPTKEEGSYLYHIDLYRLENTLEIRSLGIEEIVANPHNIVLIEWPEKIASLLPRRSWEVRLEAGEGPDSRTISISEGEIEAGTGEKV